MIKALVKCKNPEILAITPLKRGDKVSPETKKTLKRCNIPFHWISYMDTGNPYKNMVYPWRQYRKENGTPPFIIKIDNDLTCKKGMLDKLHEALVNSDRRVGYSYCCFRYRGEINVDFDHLEFSVERLVNSNYISSCSLMKSNVLEETGSFVTDDKWKGLLDWCLWLQFLRKGYIGRFVSDTSFTAYAGKGSVSTWPKGGYQEVYNRVINDFVISHIKSINRYRD